MSDKVTTMVLKVVDLHCDRCYKKIKKVLCKFPEIRNQVYDEKANKVTITVVCCNPEKMRDKLRCKGGKTIESIEIIKKTEKPTEKPVVLPGRVWACQCCGCGGHYGGPCCQGSRRPLPCYDWCGYWYEYGYCKTKICYGSWCDYFNEENTSGCKIM